MSLIRRLIPRAGVDEERGNFPRGLLPIYAPTTAGVVVTPENAARSAAVTACQRVLTSTIASLPVDVIAAGGSTRRPVSPTPSIVRSPSQFVTRRAFVAQLVKAMTGVGNASAIITGIGPRGYPTSMETVASRSVVWLPTDKGLRPHVDGKMHDLWPIGDFVHIPASPFMQPGSPVADSPVDLAKQSIGTGLAAEDFGARFFGDGFHPTVLATVDQEINAEQADAIKSRINAMRSSREPGVFGSGINLERWDVKPDDSQFIDLMRFEVEQACRFFGVPPSMAYAAVSGQSVTYANVSQADLQYLKHSVGIWLLDIEDAWSSLLPGAQQVKFAVDALLRMDAAGRHDLYRTRLESGTMTVNEVRALEDEEPFAGDEFDMPGTPSAAEQEPEQERAVVRSVERDELGRITRVVES